MLRNTEGESEILLGNKQLLGVFFVVAILLGVAFAGGYVLGHGSNKKSETSAADTATTSQTANGSLGETRSLPADREAGGHAATGQATDDPGQSSAQPAHADHTQSYQPPSGEDAEPPLGSRRLKSPAKPKASSTAPEQAHVTPPASVIDYTPQSGQTFLQVAAVSKDEAAAIADVLYKKGFHAHAVPKPGNPKIYRILIGPIRDAGDLSSTRDSLRKTGFREVIVQRY